MKKTLLLLLAVLTATTAFAEKTIAEKAAGTYNGLLYIEIDKPISEASNNYAAAIRMEAETESTVKFILPDFKYGTINLGDIVLTSIPVHEKADGTIAFGENAPQSVNVSIITANVNINHNTSFVKEGHANIDVLVSARVVFSTMNINVRFVGDNPDYVRENTAKSVGGTYNTGLYISMGSPVTADTEKFTDTEIQLTEQDANTVTFTLKNFSLDGANSLGDIVLKNIPIIENGDGTYKFGPNEPQTVSLAGGMISADVKIDENTSYVAGDKLYIDVPVQAMGQYIYVHVGEPVTTTGITTINSGRIANNTIYDLSGRRLTQRPTHPGVYIVGGRKIYLK